MRYAGKIVLLVIFLTPFLASGYSQMNQEKSVQAFVQSFLARLGDHKFETLDADFAPKARVVVTRQRENQWVNTYQTAEEWLAGLKRNPRFGQFGLWFGRPGPAG